MVERDALECLAVALGRLSAAGFFRPYGAGGCLGAVSQGSRPGLFSSLPPGGLWRSR